MAYGIVNVPGLSEGESGIQSMAVGTVTTAPAGSSASAEIVKTGTSAVLNLTIPKGDQGVQGEQGLRGLTGATGSQGPRGYTGDQGEKGEKGETGPQGPKGDKGDTGPQGPKGDKGDTGPQGPPGTSGTTASLATTTSDGLMSAADKTKLNGIAAGAQVNSVTGIKGNAESSYRTGNVNLTPANIGAAASGHTHSEYAASGHTHSEYAASGHTHNYAGSSSAGGAATSADKLNTDTGTANRPVYFKNGVPVACSCTVLSNVPADAKFSDTTYSDFEGATTSANGVGGLVPTPYKGAPCYLSSHGGWIPFEHTHSQYSTTGHTHSYAGSASAGGNAAKANTFYSPRVSRPSCNFFPGVNTTVIEEYTTTNTADLPTTDSFYQVITIQGAHASCCTQLALGFGADRAYYRRCNNGTWGNWKNLINP